MITTFLQSIWNGITGWFSWVYGITANWIPSVALFRQWLTGAEVRHFAWMGLVLKVLAALALLVYTLVELLLPLADVDAALVLLVTTIDGATQSIQAFPVGGIMAKVNRVVPLSEMLAFVGIIITTRILALAVRVGLKLIPFIG
jgi:hypothetical protein